MIEAIGQRGAAASARATGAANRSNPMDELAELMGISRRELMGELRNGSTLAEVAEARGVSRSELVDAIRTDLEVRGADPSLAESIADGSGPPLRPRSGDGLGGADVRARASEVLEPVAGVLQMSIDDLLALLEQGTSISGIASDKGVDPASLLAAMEQGLLVNASL